MPGLLLVYTGDGKGKTTAALGLLLRAAGRGQRVKLLQFMKKTGANFGEHAPLTQLGLPFEAVGDGCLLEGRPLTQAARIGPSMGVAPEDLQSRSADESERRARLGWEKARLDLQNADLDLLVLDEFTHVLKRGWVAWPEAEAALRGRPAGQHVVVTGRSALPELLALADTVTEMQNVKHAYAAGVPAQSGVEF